jgi:hypothetical protein
MIVCDTRRKVFWYWIARAEHAIRNFKTAHLIADPLLRAYAVGDAAFDVRFALARAKETREVFQRDRQS